MTQIDTDRMTIIDYEYVLQLQAAVSRAEATFGPVQVIVCNAGASTPGTLTAH